MSLNLRPRRRPVPTIPIVSLIDIMVVLLIFVVANTTFRKNKTKMTITLPTSKGMGTTSAAPDQRVTLAITKDNQVFLDGAPVAMDHLAETLKTFRASRSGARLELEADAVAGLGTLVEVWDALKDAGIAISDVPARLQRPKK